MNLQVTARLPAWIGAALDGTATELRCSRADVKRLAIANYLEDFDDLSVAIARFHAPDDAVLDRERVHRQLLDAEQGK